MKCALRSFRVALLGSPARLGGLLLILAYAFLYGLTLDNGLRPGELAGGDLITHQYAQVQGRFSNAPGYPLYTMGGWVWFRIGRLLLGPDSNPIAILSSYSTFWALVALGLLYALILEVIAQPTAGEGQTGQSYMPGWVPARSLSVERTRKTDVAACCVPGRALASPQGTDVAACCVPGRAPASPQGTDVAAWGVPGQAPASPQGTDVAACCVPGQAPAPPQGTDVAAWGVPGRAPASPQGTDVAACCVPGRAPASTQGTDVVAWGVPGQAPAAGFSEQTARHATRSHHNLWPLALLASAFYGVTYFFWYYAVTTEQYTSSVAWTLAFTLLALRWERTQAERYLLGMALLTGIGLAHQITVLAIVPPALVLVLSRKPWLLKDGKLVGRVIGLALLPLLSYIYVYVRGAQHPEWRGAGQWESTWQWFWSFVSTEQGRNELTWSLSPFFTHEFPALIWGEMTWPGLILGLLGWLSLGRRRAGFLFGTLAIYLAFCWVDRLGNWYQVIMTVYGLLTVGIAAAAAWWIGFGRGEGTAEAVTTKGDERTAEAVTTKKGGEGKVGRWALALAVLVALIAYRATASYPRADASNRPDDTGLLPAWAILADDPPHGAAVLTTHDEGLAMNYLTQIWGKRPDLVVITPDQAGERFVGEGFLVTTAALPLVPGEIGAEACYSALGRTLIAVYRDPKRTVPAGLLPWSHDFAGTVRLLGGRLKENPVTGEHVVMLAWLAPAPPAEDWSVSVRLTQMGTDLDQYDHAHPVFGAYPMTRWRAGEVVLDAYPLKQPTGAAADGITVILYRRAEDGNFVNLDVAHFPLAPP